MKIIKKLALFAIFASICAAQLAFPTTTLNSNMTPQSPWLINVASTAGMNSFWSFPQTVLVIDGEALCINLVLPGGYVQAERGCQGTNTQNHSVGATVYVGPGSYYYFLPPGSAGQPCTASNYMILPWIVLNSGGNAVKFNCTGGVWVVS